MCGLAGYFGKKQLELQQIQSTIDVMKKRGPDHQDFVNIRSDENNITLIHSRLSIIDLDPRSNQPFRKEDCVLVYNGEIYNYIELRKELQKKEVQFTTSSDTEVVLNYYLKYGEKCVDYFEGMWCFALYDGRRNKLFLSRDRFAEKPLYYFRSEDGFYFASEIKAIKRLSNERLTINQNHLHRYLVNGHKSLYKTKETFYQEISELDFASNLVISDTGFKEYKYWCPQYKPQNISEADALEGTRHHLSESLKIRLRSDVPLAFCLSGGVDSASLVSIAAKEFNYDVKTFSIIDDDHRYDEHENIEATVKDTGCDNTKIILDSAQDNIQRLKELVDYHDAPVATISYFVHSMLSEAISKQGYKISISGTAADEIFTGYYDHFNLHLAEVKNDSDYLDYLNNWKKYPAPFVRHPDLQKSDLYFKDKNFREHIYLNNNLFKSFLKPDFNESFSEFNYSNSLLRNRMMNEMFNEVVRVILHEDDLNSMKYSLENRSPFLDTKLFEFVNSIPSKMLIKNGYAKYLLRESMEGILNDKVRLSREKKGFNASINSILDFNNPDHRAYILDDSPVFEFIKKDKIEDLIGQDEFPNSYKKFLFNFINTKVFLELHE